MTIQRAISMGSKPRISQSTAFSPGADAAKTEVYSTTRSQVLERISNDMEKKQVGKRLAGKVGIITGVGPSTGIGVRQIRCPGTVRANRQSNAARLMAREGARHLYLLDYSQQVEAFSKSLRQEYPDMKVRSITRVCRTARALTTRCLASLPTLLLQTQSAKLLIARWLKKVNWTFSLPMQE